MRIVHWALLGVLVAAIASAQSLGDTARKEKKRREENQRSGAAVRVITDSDVRPGTAPVARSESDSQPEGELAPASPAMPAGALAPDFSLPDRSGRSYSLADFHGRPLLVDFWATWCGPCRRTMPEVERLHRKYRGQLQVVGINIEGRSPDVLTYLDKGGYSFPVLFDSGDWEAATAKRYGVDSIPRTFLLDGDGHILYQGMPHGLTEELIQTALSSR